MIKRSLAGVALALSLAACGDHPVPEHGRVTDAKFTPAGVTIIPAGPPICTGTGASYMCTPGTPMQIIPYPDEWRLEITDLNNPEWVGTVEVQKDCAALERDTPLITIALERYAKPEYKREPSEEGSQIASAVMSYCPEYTESVMAQAKRLQSFGSS